MNFLNMLQATDSKMSHTHMPLMLQNKMHIMQTKKIKFTDKKRLKKYQTL